MNKDKYNNTNFGKLDQFKIDLKNYNIKFTIKNNIINFIDNLIKKETYFEIKKDIDSLVNNINKILKDQNDIKILNYNIKYFIDSVNKLNDKNKKNFIEILKNYEQSIEIYKEYLKNNNNNKNTKKIKSNIFKDKINQQLNKISKLISDVSNNNNNKKYYNKFYVNYILKYIEILNKFEKNYIIYKFKLNTNNISKFNEDDDKNPIYTLKNIKEDFKIFSKEKEKGKQNNNNNLKNSFNDELKKIDTKIESVNQEISNLTNEQKKTESYKNNTNYKNLNSNIKSNQQKIKTIETKISTIDEDKESIKTYTLDPILGKTISSNNLKDEDKINKLIEDLNSLLINPAHQRFSRQIKNLIAKCDTLKDKYNDQKKLSELKEKFEKKKNRTIII